MSPDLRRRLLQVEKEQAEGERDPERYPLVAANSNLRARAGLATQPNPTTDQIALTMRGFVWNCWIPLKVARKLKSGYYPKSPTKEAISQLESWLIVVEEIGRPNPADLARERKNDLRLLRAVLRERTPHKKRRKRRPKSATVKKLRLANPPTIIAMGDRQYRIGESEPVTFTFTEDKVIQPFLTNPAMDKPTLQQKSEVDDAPRVLKRISKKHGGRFAPAIELPNGRKAIGGYRVRISLAPKPRP